MEMQCSICCDILVNDLVHTHCQGRHHFHTSCLSKWFNSSHTCPLCRELLSENVITSISVGNLKQPDALIPHGVERVRARVIIEPLGQMLVKLRDLRMHVPSATTFRIINPRRSKMMLYEIMPGHYVESYTRAALLWCKEWPTNNHLRLLKCKVLVCNDGPAGMYVYSVPEEIECSMPINTYQWREVHEWVDDVLGEVNISGLPIIVYTVFADLYFAHLTCFKLTQKEEYQALAVVSMYQALIILKKPLELKVLIWYHLDWRDNLGKKSYKRLLSEMEYIKHTTYPNNTQQ